MDSKHEDISFGTTGNKNECTGFKVHVESGKRDTNRLNHPITDDQATVSSSATQASASDMHPIRWLFGFPFVAAAPGSNDLAVQDAHHLEPLPPSKDPWYSAPDGFEAKRPGDILRVRTAPGNLTSIVNNTLEAYHILFRTTDALKNPGWAVTSLFIPKRVRSTPSGKTPLLTYPFAYNTANLDSAPSIGLYWHMAQNDPNLGIKAQTDLIANMLGEGWVVSTPDHLGPRSAFGSSLQSGYATLDSLRAINGLAAMMGVCDFKSVLWGYSGGSIAAVSGAQMQSTYAPELRIDGVALGGLVDDVVGSFSDLNKSPIAGNFVAFLLGITAYYPEATAYLESRLKNETKAEFLSARDIHVFETMAKFAGRDIYDFFLDGEKDLEAPILRKVFAEQGTMGRPGVPQALVFTYKAIGDQFCPIERTDETVKRWCNAGVKVRYERNTVGEHVSEIENGKFRALRFVKSIFEETYEAPADGCDIEDVTVKV